MVNTWKSLQVLFKTLLVSLPSLVNISMLLVLVVFVFSIVGVQLYGNIKFQDAIDHHANFMSFGLSFMLLVRVNMPWCVWCGGVWMLCSLCLVAGAWCHVSHRVK